jgi:hypothetical protein
MQILICLYVIQTYIYLIQTCLYDVCVCIYVFVHTYKINHLLLCLCVPKNIHKYEHAVFLMHVSTSRPKTTAIHTIRM